MQSEPLWNVAGIPLEAREAARASARREGLSVGEWLSRRILRSVAGMDAQQHVSWKSGVNRVPEKRRSDTDRVEMRARASPAQQESQYVWTHIEDQMNKLVRGVEQIERSHSESARAMTRARAEIDILLRGRAQAFGRVGARVAQLDERMLHIERRAQADTTRKALDALCEGLSHLANRFARTEKNAADRTAQLATRIETMVLELASHREDAQQSARTQADRMSLAENSLEKLEAGQNARSDHAEEISRQAEAVALLSQMVGDHTGELVSSETRSSAALTRLEARLSSLEDRLNDAPVNDRLQSVERAVMDIRVRSEQGERKRADASDAIEAQLRALAAQMDAAEKSNHDAIAELGAIVRETARKVERTDPGPPPVQAAPEAAFDLPAVDDSAPQASAPQALPELPSPLQTEIISNPDTQPPIDTSGPASPGLASYLVAAERTTGVASDSPVADAWRGKFLSVFNTADPPESSEHSNLRLFVGGGMALIAVAAVGATLLLGDHAHVPAMTTAQRMPVEAAPAGTAAGPSSQERLAALANSGSSKAQELLGLRYVDGDGMPVNEAEGAKWLTRAAAHGEALAAYRLGTLYEHGHGVPTDPARAVKWYLAAAKAGNRKAMHNLAVAYAEGFGVPKNPVVAAEWFAHAAELGLSDSQFDLGVLYERGMGVPQSLIDAYKWYAIAAAKGDPGSRARIETLGSELGAEDKAAAEQAAAEFRAAPPNRAANTPPDAATLLGG